MQNLTPTAARMKAIRDKKAAMTEKRKKRKRENQVEDRKNGTVGDGKDRHHKSDGTTVVITEKNNRGNYGRGTKNE
tara:strand:+ start:269 stop:496 length:228 start_codon:yes stop_codon:yes gene_type:complete